MELGLSSLWDTVVHSTVSSHVLRVNGNKFVFQNLHIAHDPGEAFPAAGSLNFLKSTDSHLPGFLGQSPGRLCHCAKQHKNEHGEAAAEIKQLTQTKVVQEDC